MAEAERICTGCKTRVESAGGSCPSCGERWLRIGKLYWCYGAPAEGSEQFRAWNRNGSSNSDGVVRVHSDWVNLALPASDRDGRRWIRLKPEGWDGSSLWFHANWVWSVPGTFNKPCVCDPRSATCDQAKCGHFHREMLDKGYEYNKWLPRGHRYVMPK